MTRTGDNSDLARALSVVAVLDGVTVDGEVTFEMGYATAMCKPIIGARALIVNE